MLEQYIYNKITEDTALQSLLSAGSDDFYLYPNVIPRSLMIDVAVTFTTIITTDVFPASKSVQVQFNIFAKSHSKVVEIANALSDLFNEDNNNSSDGVGVVFSIRKSESDIGFDFDDELYQREATYYFKIR
jgi:hypothetical protein